MTKILVVGLVVILAAAGSGRADGTNSQSSTSSGTTGSAGSSGSGHPLEARIHLGAAPCNRVRQRLRVQVGAARCDRVR